MNDTQTQIDRLIELAIVQRTELKQLVEQLPELREHLSAEIERTIEEVEPQLRTELEEFCDKRAVDANAKVGAALEAKIVELCKNLEATTQARYGAIKDQENKVEELRQLAAKQIEGHAAALPDAVKEIVTDELSRFPRAGEIEQLRKEFAEPKGLNPRGKWSPDETYQRLDLVTINGDSFVSNINGNRQKPSRTASDWTLNAARGNSGGGGGVFSSINELLPVPSPGQILGSQDATYVPKALVAGANITITESPTEITIIGDEGELELQDGTAAAPSLFFVNDIDTGLFRVGANTLGIAVGGTQAAAISSTTFAITPNTTIAGTLTANGTSIPASKTLVVTTDKISALAATTSAELAGVISDETGSGSLVFANSPTLVTPALGTPSALVGTNITGTAAGLTAGNVTTNANLTGDVTSVGNATSIAAGVIVDADINASAAIVDTKLATISTALKVSNSATTATSANTASAIVARDGSGDFSAGTITANLTGNVSGSSGSTTGNAATATALATGRTIAITGDLAYTSPSFDGTGNVTAAGTLATVATPGSTGSSTEIPIVTINAKGLTTSITTAAVVAPAGTLSGNTLASGVTASSLTSLGTIASLTATAGTVANAPSGSTDIANKAYVDSVAQGLDAKASCVAATTADITLSGAQTIDGVSVIAGDRVLVKNQTLSQNNGIYLCASGAWTRTSDADTWDELTSAFTFIEQGTTNADTGYVCTANSGGTLGTTALPWSQFSGAGTFTAGTGLTLTGSVFSLTSPVAVANGGTGLTSLGSGVATFLGTPSSANLAAAVTDETGSGALVFATSPTLVTPALGTPSSGTVTNLTGTASININGTVGATTPTTGVFTALTVNDNSTLGSSNTDTVTFNARVASDINPSADDTYDLGIVGHEWRNLNIDGTANIDSLVADTADINAGTIDGTAIGATTPSTGAFTTLSATTSVTTPSLTNAGTLALSATGANILTAATNGVERMRIDSSGNVGIGGSNDGAYGKLRVVGSGYQASATQSTGGAVAYMAANDNSEVRIGAGSNHPVDIYSNGSGRMRIDTSGNVGIGTASPSAPLTIGVGSGLGSNPTNASSLQIRQANSTVEAAGLEFLGSTFGAGYGFKWSAIDSSGVHLTLSSRENSATWSEKLRVTTSGNVLIGTTTNSSNGILQLTSHTTSAGGIGFGTDVTLYRSAANTLKTDDDLVVTGALSSTGAFTSGAAISANFANARIEWFDTSAGTDAKRWDILSGGGVQSFRLVNDANSAANTWLQCNRTGFASATIAITGNTSVTGTLSATGALAIGNTVNTVSPTSPNRTVTIVIGGTTYYLHAKTTND